MEALEFFLIVARNSDVIPFFFGLFSFVIAQSKRASNFSRHSNFLEFMLIKSINIWTNLTFALSAVSWDWNVNHTNRRWWNEISNLEKKRNERNKKKASNRRNYYSLWLRTQWRNKIRTKNDDVDLFPFLYSFQSALMWSRKSVVEKIFDRPIKWTATTNYWDASRKNYSQISSEK